jgi:glucodextranase-like protein
VLAVLLAALLPATASATVTGSTVTSPASPHYPYWDESTGTPSLTIEATTDGGPRDLVDLVCTRGPNASIQFTDVKVGAGGRVSVRVGYDELSRWPCTYRIVPAGYRGPDFSAFSGSVVALTSYYETKVAIHSTEDTAPLTYAVNSGNLRGLARAGSAGDHGLEALVGVPAGTLEPFTWETWTDGAALVAGRTAPGITVDGQIAYAAAEIPRFDFDGPEGPERVRAPEGFAGVRSSVRHDPRTGAVTITESQPLQRCPRIENEETPDADNCAFVVDTGVRLERTIALTAAHAVADIRDRWVSADGRSHAVGARYRALAPAKIAPPLWRFPGEALFAARREGEVLAPRGPGTALIKEDDVKAVARRAPGAMSFAPAAALVTFGPDVRETVALTVPAGGAVPVRRAFAVGDDVAEAERHGRGVEDSFAAPRVTLAAAATTTAPTVVVRGRATDNVGVTALTVAGRRVVPAADGSFATGLDLEDGRNAIVATATDGAGLTATARTEISRICRVPKVRRGARVKAARAALARAGCAARKRTKRVRSGTVRKGRVVGLTQRAGTVLRGGAAIGIRVSRGRKIGGIRN